MQFEVLNLFNAQTEARQPISEVLNCVFEEDDVRAQGVSHSCLGRRALLLAYLTLGKRLLALITRCRILRSKLTLSAPSSVMIPIRVPLLQGVGVWNKACNFLKLGKTLGWVPASEPLNMQQPSIQVRNLLETAVLQIQHSPDLSEDEVRWIQQFAAHLITEFNVLDEGLFQRSVQQVRSIDR